jgi:hypothetical protein
MNFHPFRTMMRQTTAARVIQAFLGQLLNGLEIGMHYSPVEKQGIVFFIPIKKLMSFESVFQGIFHSGKNQGCLTEKPALAVLGLIPSEFVLVAIRVKNDRVFNQKATDFRRYRVRFGIPAQSIFVVCE